MEKFLDLVYLSRKKLNGNRNVFWNENKKNFKKNIKKLISCYKVPKGWKIYVVASNFLFDRKIFPFDYDSWSSTNLIAATKKQGFEIMIFFNKARLEFLSLSALIPLVEHEFEHVKQATKNPREYLISIINDKLSKKLEAEAEKKADSISGEFRRQWALESIVYCYDIGGWKLAKKMAGFLYKEMENLYGGGYNKGMNNEEYETFLKAMKIKEISVFISFFK